MAEVEVNHPFISPKPASADPTRIDGPKWNDDMVFAGGSDGQVASRDSATTNGASWMWATPAIPVTSLDEIPNGQVRFFYGGSPTRFAVVFNNDGTFIEISVTP